MQAKSFIEKPFTTEEKGFAKLQHRLDEGMIDPSDTKRLKTNPSP
jgi:hypothetical protein